MVRLLVLIVLCLGGIWLVMASVEPGRDRARPEPAQATTAGAPPVTAVSASARPAPVDRPATAAQLAPDTAPAAALPDAAARPFPGPVLHPSPQYPDAPAPAEATAGTRTDAPAGAATRWVSAERVNLRAGPGTDHAVVGSVTRGQAVELLAAETDGWVRIDAPGGQQGFVAARFLSATAP